MRWWQWMMKTGFNGGNGGGVWWRQLRLTALKTKARQWRWQCKYGVWHQRRRVAMAGRGGAVSALAAAELAAAAGAAVVGQSSSMRQYSCLYWRAHLSMPTTRTLLDTERLAIPPREQTVGRSSLAIPRRWWTQQRTCWRVTSNSPTRGRSTSSSCRSRAANIPSPTTIAGSSIVLRVGRIETAPNWCYCGEEEKC